MYLYGFVALSVRMCDAGANKDEGTVSWCLGTNEILASKHHIEVKQGHFETAVLILHIASIFVNFWKCSVMCFLGASCKFMSLSSIMALKFLAVSSRAFLDLICISSSPLFANGPAKFLNFCYFRHFLSVLFVIFPALSRALIDLICLFVKGLAKFRNFRYFRCFVEGPLWPHLHFLVTFRQ